MSTLYQQHADAAFAREDRHRFAHRLFDRLCPSRQAKLNRLDFIALVVPLLEEFEMTAIGKIAQAALAEINAAKAQAATAPDADDQAALAALAAASNVDASGNPLPAPDATPTPAAQ